MTLVFSGILVIGVALMVVERFLRDHETRIKNLEERAGKGPVVNEDGEVSDE